MAENHISLPSHRKTMEYTNSVNLLGAGRQETVTRYTFDAETTVDITEISCTRGDTEVSRILEVGRVMVDGVRVDPPSA